MITRQPNKLRTYFQSLVILSLISLLAACVTPQYRLDLAKQSFQEQNYRQAYHRLKPLAEKGIPDAQYALGYLFYYGLGVTEDRERGKMLIEKAAAQGSQQAKDALAVMTD